MIQLIIPYLITQIESLELFRNIIGLAEIITKGEDSYPAQYCGKGNYKNVLDIDYKNGLIYFRKTGSVTIDPSDNNSIGSENDLKITIPLRAVFAIKKNTVKGLDDSFIDDKMCLNLIKVITDNNVRSLKQSLKVSTVGFIVQNWNTSREQVWSEEFKNIPMEMDFEYVYASIDFNVNIEGSKECFTEYNCE
jgi:hypothetical protein